MTDNNEISNILNQKLCEEKNLIPTSFENYTDTCINYDEGRYPVGLKNYFEIFQNSKNKSLCDIGCGTGNYIIPFINKFEYICGIDLNFAMLSIANQKINNNFKLTNVVVNDDTNCVNNSNNDNNIANNANNSNSANNINNIDDANNIGKINNVELIHADMKNIPKNNETFDYIMFNQSIHHIHELDIIVALTEAHRILKIGGTCIINTCTSEQQKNSFWWASLIPNAIEKVQKKFPMKHSMDNNFINMVLAIGFELYKKEIIYEHLQGNQYYNINGPFNKKYRDADSTWKLATEDELNNGLFLLENIINSNKSNDWLNERKKIEHKYGQSIMLVFKKIE